jgi:hypothetical protein
LDHLLWRLLLQQSFDSIDYGFDNGAVSLTTIQSFECDKWSKLLARFCWPAGPHPGFGAPLSILHPVRYGGRFCVSTSSLQICLVDAISFRKPNPCCARLWHLALPFYLQSHQWAILHLAISTLAYIWTVLFSTVRAGLARNMCLPAVVVLHKLSSAISNLPSARSLVQLDDRKLKSVRHAPKPFGATHMQVDCLAKIGH